MICRACSRARHCSVFTLCRLLARHHSRAGVAGGGGGIGAAQDSPVSIWAKLLATNGAFGDEFDIWAILLWRSFVAIQPCPNVRLPYRLTSAVVALSFFVDEPCQSALAPSNGDGFSKCSLRIHAPKNTAFAVFVNANAVRQALPHML